MIVSIIICTYNRSSDLKLVLESILRLKIPSHWTYELLLVDNNSKDDTKNIILQFQQKFEGRLKYLFEPQQGKSYAMNQAIKESKGTILCFTDDDVILDELWLTKTLECFDKNNCEGVGGRVLPIFSADTPQWVKDNAVKLSGSVVIYDYGEESKELISSMYPFIGANYSFKKEVFDQLGYFRVDLGAGRGSVGEDTEFVERLLDKGKILFYCGQALVWHPFTFKRLTLKHVAQWNIGLGKYTVQRQIEKKEKFVYCFGVPRYLIRAFIQDLFCLIGTVFSRPAFYIAWRNLFYRMGMIQEYQRINQKKAIFHA